MPWYEVSSMLHSAPPVADRNCKREAKQLLCWQHTLGPQLMVRTLLLAWAGVHDRCEGSQGAAVHAG